MRFSILRSGIATLAVALLTACASVMPGANYPKEESHALPPSRPAGLEKIVDQAARAPEQRSGYRMLSAGIDGLLARIEMIDAAQRSLDLQYYIFRADQSGLIVASALLRAAERGVRVRLILDDGDTVRGDEKILALSAQQGIEVRLFNPFRYRGHNGALRGAEFLLNKNRLDYRMHNKLLVVDNSVALIGGRNIGDQYFQIDPASQFGDDDAVTVGPMVQQLSAVFDEFWNSAEVIPARAIDHKNTTEQALDKLRAAITAQGKEPSEADTAFLARLKVGEPLSGIESDKTPLSFASGRLVYDSPNKKDVATGKAPGELIYSTVAQEAKTVNDEMIMVTPYLVPAPDMMKLLKTERSRNAHVRILTNSLSSAPDLAAQAGYMHYRIELLEEGVELYEIRAQLGSTRGSGQGKAISQYGNYALHGKLFAFDRKSIFVGSMNFDQRSKRLNTEIGLVVYSPNIAQQTALRFEELTKPDNAYTVELRHTGDPKPYLVWKTRESGVDKEYTTEPARSEGQKFKVEVLTLLPIDKEL